MKKHTILFLAANPLGTSEAALADEARAIQAELDLAGHRDRFEFVTRWGIQPLDLLRELRKLKPTVVHFTGQRSRSAVDTSPAGDMQHDDRVDGLAIDRAHPRQHGMLFRGPDNRPFFVPTTALEGAFNAAGKSVQVVVLNACYSDPQAEALTAQVDCVVAGDPDADAGVALAERLAAVASTSSMKRFPSPSRRASYQSAACAISFSARGDSSSDQVTGHRPAIRARSLARASAHGTGCTTPVSSSLMRSSSSTRQAASHVSGGSPSTLASNSAARSSRCSGVSASASSSTLSAGVAMIHATRPTSGAHSYWRRAPT
jgi:hypothetical protein